MSHSFRFVIFLNHFLISFSLSASTLLVPSSSTPTIQSALDLSSDGDEIQVEPGTYHENLIFPLHSIDLISTEGADVTVINGSLSNTSTLTIVHEGFSDKVYVIRGFRITGGSGRLVGPYRQGGGLYSSGGNLKLIDMIFEANSANGSGFEGNAGGAVRKVFGELEIENCSFLHNSTKGDGGALSVSLGSVMILNSIFKDNSAQAKGGAISETSSSSFTAINLLVAENSAAFGGAMNFESGNSHKIINSTITQNSSNTSEENPGGAIHANQVNHFPYLEIHNSIIWNNTAADIVISSFEFNDSTAFVSNSTIGLGYAYEGGTRYVVEEWINGQNISVDDPLFVNPVDSNYSLSELSAVINSGSTETYITAGGGPTDVLSQARFVDEVDQGAIEFQGTPLIGGACCVPGLLWCAVTTDVECLSLGGNYAGDSTACNNETCGAASGACCNDDGSCSEISESSCNSNGGNFEGEFIACSETSCEVVEPTGACCINEFCLTATEDLCLGAGGSFQGDTTACLPSPCNVEPKPCPADITQDGEVGQPDLIAMLANWGSCSVTPCDADLNSDEMIDFSDLVVLLGAWGTCP